MLGERTEARVWSMADDKKKSSKNADEPVRRVDISGEAPDDDASPRLSQNENSQQILVAMDDDGTVQSSLMDSIPGVKVADDDGGAGGGGGKGGAGGGDDDSDDDDGN